MVTFHHITRATELTPIRLQRAGFAAGFDWQQLFPQAQLIAARSDRQLAGLIAFTPNTHEFFNRVELLEVAIPFRLNGIGAQLLAVVMWDAFERPGFDGVINLKTKSDGVERFYRHLGGFQLAQTIIFETAESAAVIHRYLPQGGLIK